MMCHVCLLQKINTHSILHFMPIEAIVTYVVIKDKFGN